MKKIKVLAVVFLLGFLTFSSNVSAQSMIGVTVIPSFSGPALGVRQWINPKIGWGLEGQTNWTFNTISARARFMYTLHTIKNTRFYGLLSGGYMAGNSGGISISSPTAVGGIGAEMLLGFKKNMGLSLEIGYQYGQIVINSYYGNYTAAMFPVYIGGSFSYYFKK